MLENDRENDRDESHQIFYVSAEPSANGVYFPIKRRSLLLEHLNSCSEKTPVIVQSFQFFYLKNHLSDPFVHGSPWRRSEQLVSVYLTKPFPKWSIMVPMFLFLFFFLIIIKKTPSGSLTSRWEVSVSACGLETRYQESLPRWRRIQVTRGGGPAAWGQVRGLGPAPGTDAQASLSRNPSCCGFLDRRQLGSACRGFHRLRRFGTRVRGVRAASSGLALRYPAPPGGGSSAVGFRSESCKIPAMRS